MDSNEEGTVISRLKQFIDFCELSNSQFADKAGIPRPTLSQLIHGRNKSVNDLLLRKLHEAFPALNITWLLFGLGSMLEDSNIQFSEPQKHIKSEISEGQLFDFEDPANLQNPPAKGAYEQSKQKIEPELSDFEPFSTFSAAFSGAKSDPDLSRLPSPPPDKKIKSIIVLYTDSSFEVFSPDKTDN